MQTPSPVNRNVTFVAAQASGALCVGTALSARRLKNSGYKQARTHRATCRNRAIFKKPVKHGTVITDIVWNIVGMSNSRSEEQRSNFLTLVLFLHEGIHVAGRYPTEKVDVFIRVKLGHFPFRSGFGTLRAASVS